MRIFLDIAHPKYFHSSKNFVHILQERGHEFFITARDKECTLELLVNEGLPFYNRGKGAGGIVGRIQYTMRTDWLMYRLAKKFGPDLFVSFGSPYTAHAAFLYHKPHIVFDDTDYNAIVQSLYKPFTKTIFVPSCYENTKTNKYRSFDGYLELAYLHPLYFIPKENIFNDLGLKSHEKYIVIRFVSWGAVHDIGKTGLTDLTKLHIVRAFEKYARVFISSETELPEELKKYQLALPSYKMHDVLAGASLFYGESSTMAAEAAVLGIPTIYVSNVVRGYTRELEKRYQLICYYPAGIQEVEKSIKQGIEILKNPESKNEWQGRRQKMLAEKTDVTAFMVMAIEEYEK